MILLPSSATVSLSPSQMILVVGTVFVLLFWAVVLARRRKLQYGLVRKDCSSGIPLREKFSLAAPRHGSLKDHQCRRWRAGVGGRKPLHVDQNVTYGYLPQSAHPLRASSSPSPPPWPRAGDSLLPPDFSAALASAVDVVQETGLRPTIVRTLQAQRALLETVLELRTVLPPPPRELIVEALQPRFPLPETAEEAFAPVLTYVRSLPPDLAPRVLRGLFERLGATWIKIGQFIASSPTLFPPEYVVEFQALLDKAPAIDFDTVRDIVEAELGAPLSDLFGSFDPQPLASASIAQVHAATLRDGTDVVVKVQRPEVSDLLRADLGFVAVASQLLQAVVPDLARLSVADIATDLRESMLGELDFEREADNLEAFDAFVRMHDSSRSDNLGNGDGGDGVGELGSRVASPLPFRALTSKKVLTMTRLFGVPITDVDALPPAHAADPERTVLTALNTWLLSVIEAESFHADVHAGNLLALDDGRVGFIDFGIVGRVPSTMWDALQETAMGLASEDSRAIARGLIAMGATMGTGGGQSTDSGGAMPGSGRGAGEARGTDEEAFAADIERVIQSMRSVDPTVVVNPEAGTVGVGLDEQAVTRLALDVVAAADRNGVKLPREFGLLLKQVLYFDRYTKLLAPDVDVMQEFGGRGGDSGQMDKGVGGSRIIDVA